ncbi:TPA: hypothetical protein ACGMQ6_001348 [Streptococcus agalactiae]
MKINKNSLFYIAIFLVNFFKSLGLGEGNSTYKIVMFVAIFLCGIKFLLDSLYFERRKLVIIFLLFIATILNLFFVHKVTFILTLIFFSSIKGYLSKKSFLYNNRIAYFGSSIKSNFCEIRFNRN